MTRNSDDKSSGASKRNRNRNLKQVEDLYRQADKAHGGFAEAPNSDFKRPDGNGNRSPKAEEREIQQVSRHEWVLHVLADLAEYAREERLESVRFCLEDARQCVLQMLKEEVSADGSPDADLPDDDDR